MRTNSSRRLRLSLTLSAALVVGLLATGSAMTRPAALNATATIASAGGTTYVLTLSNTGTVEIVRFGFFPPTSGTISNVRPSPACQADTSVLCVQTIQPGASMQVCFDATLEAGGPGNTIITVADAGPGRVNVRPTVVAPVSACPVASGGPTVRCVVPNVVGKKLAAAKGALGRAHCGVGRVSRKHSAHAPKGRVISQSPKRGKTLPKGTKVKLVVSKGK